MLPAAHPALLLVRALGVRAALAVPAAAKLRLANVAPAAAVAKSAVVTRLRIGWILPCRECRGRAHTPCSSWCRRSGTCRGGRHGAARALVGPGPRRPPVWRLSRLRSLRRRQARSQTPKI